MRTMRKKKNFSERILYSEAWVENLLGFSEAEQEEALNKLQEKKNLLLAQ
jgi:hypothetical protein